MEASKRGRPKKSEGSKQINMRYPADVVDMLDYLVQKKQQSQSEVVFQAIKAQYNFEKFKSDC